MWRQFSFKPGNLIIYSKPDRNGSNRVHLHCMVEHVYQNRIVLRDGNNRKHFVKPFNVQYAGKGK